MSSSERDLEGSDDSRRKIIIGAAVVAALFIAIIFYFLMRASSGGNVEPVLEGALVPVPRSLIKISRNSISILRKPTKLNAP